MGTNMDFPKIIWFAWFQGLEQAPEIVKICYESWVSKNPGWDVRFCDLAIVDDFLLAETGSTFNHIPIEKKSNLFRLNILRKHGGVWADATTLCATPLDKWLIGYLNTGFFVLRDPSKNKILSSWFMAAMPGCKLMEKYCLEHTRFWIENKFPKQDTFIRKKLKKYIYKYAKSSPEKTLIWFNPIVLKKMKIFPYTILHYHLKYLLKNNPELSHIFYDAKYMSAHTAQQLRRCRQLHLSIEETRKILMETDPPIHKLSWKEKVYPSQGIPHREYLSKVVL